MGSRIEWTDEVWNPVSGCSKVSEGCRNCYAERLFPRVYGKQVEEIPLDEVGIDGKRTRPRRFTDVRLHEDRLATPLRWTKPRRVFVNSMSDLFHEDVPVDFVETVFAVMANARNHTFQVLTKRPDRMRTFFSHSMRPGFVAAASAQDLRRSFTPETWPAWPLPNVWLGVSVEDQATADERIPVLLTTPAAVRFASIEPLLGPIDLSGFEDAEGIEYAPLSGNRRRLCGDGVRDGEIVPDEVVYANQDGFPRLDWVIVGGESGPKARPMRPTWVREIRDRCVEAGVPFFFKQWGEWAPDCLCQTKRSHRTTRRPGPGRVGYMFRCGKRAAGRLLDGREWSEYPNEESEG